MDGQAESNIEGMIYSHNLLGLYAKRLEMQVEALTKQVEMMDARLKKGERASDESLDGPPEPIPAPNGQVSQEEEEILAGNVD